MSSSVAVAFVIAVLVVGGLIGYAIYQWGGNLPSAGRPGPS